jgi:hypothetical protein
MEKDASLKMLTSEGRFQSYYSWYGGFKYGEMSSACESIVHVIIANCYSDDVDFLGNFIDPRFGTEQSMV